MTFRHPKATVIVLALLIAAAAMALVFVARRDRSAEAPKRVSSSTPIRIALDPWPGYVSVFVAQDKGFFEKNGVRVEIIISETGASSTEIYESGQADGIFDVFSDTVRRNLQGKPTKAVYALDYSTTADVIVGKPGMAYPSGLKGKRIGYEGWGSFSHLFVSTILDRAGIAPSDVTFVDVPALKILDALESGAIDVGHTWEPARSDAISRGYVQYDDAGSYSGLIIDVLSFSAEAIETREADIEAVVRSLAEAAAYAERHPDEAIAISASAQGMREEAVRSGLAGIHLLDRRENADAFAYTTELTSLHGVFRKMNAFFMAIGLTDSLLDSTAFVDARFVRRLPEKIAASAE